VATLNHAYKACSFEQSSSEEHKISQLLYTEQKYPQYDATNKHKNSRRQTLYPINEEDRAIILMYRKGETNDGYAEADSK